MKIKMLTAVAGDRFSYSYGDIADVPDAVGQAWIDTEMAILAPEGDEAAQLGVVQSQQIATLSAERDSLQSDLDAANAKLAEALKLRDGAKAESASLSKALDVAKAAKAEAEKKLNAALLEVARLSAADKAAQ